MTPRPSDSRDRPARRPPGDVARPDARPEPPLGDVALVFGQDEQGTHILRRRSEEAPLEAGLLRPLREGKPIDGEIIRLTPRREGPMLFDVKTELPDPRGQRATSEGPAQVANEAYRRGWDAVWGSRRRGSPVLN